MVTQTKRGPITQVRLTHPTHLPVYRKVAHYRRHPSLGPPMTLLTGGSGARSLSEVLIKYSHSCSHVLPVFDDGGSSRALREAFGIPPPGDLRNRLMALSDMTMDGNPEVGRLFKSRLPRAGEPAALQAELEAYLRDDHPQMSRIESRLRRIIVNHLERFVAHKGDDFDLRHGSIGNFVIAGAYLSVREIESVIFEFSALAAVRGEVHPVCCAGDFHLKATFADGSELVGQSAITSERHPPIQRLSFVERRDGAWVEVRPRLNPLVARAIRKAALVGFAMGSFYTSLASNLLVDGMGQAIRQLKRPKVFVANLRRDKETHDMKVSEMLLEVCAALRSSDSEPGEVRDYVHYALVGTHGDSAEGGRVPVDLDAIRALGVEPIELPIESEDGLHDPELVAAVLLSLC